MLNNLISVIMPAYNHEKYVQEAIKSIQQNKRKFENLLKFLKRNTNIDEKLLIAQQSATFATYNSCGYFTSSELENFYCDYSQSLDNNCNINYDKNSVLHVITEAYKTGGHTRVVERWITLAPEYEKHSVVILKQFEDVPIYLKNAVEKKNGNIYVYNVDEDITTKALKLRNLASKFHYIVLHIHMDDPTALVAFGTEKFTRPIIFFNHASHMFWLGKNISDIVVDFHSITNIIKTRRGIPNSFLLGLPQSQIKINNKDKIISRKNLNLPLDKKIIITVGSEHKYKPLNGESIIPTIMNIIDNTSDVVCYAIGPSMESEMWKSAFQDSNNRIIPIGLVDYDKEYFDYVNSADIIIDSWPMGGGTVLIDALHCKKPILSLHNPIGQCDYVCKSICYCKNKDELTEKAIKILSDKNVSDFYFNDIYNYFIEETSNKNWSIRLNELIKIIPDKHNVKILCGQKDYNKIDEYNILLLQMYGNINTQNKMHKLLINLFKYYLYKVLKNKNKKMRYLRKMLDNCMYDI